MMRFVLSIFVLLFASKSLAGDRTRLDSLLAKESTFKKDTNAIKSYIKIANRFKKVNSDSSDIYFNKAIQLANGLKSKQFYFNAKFDQLLAIKATANWKLYNDSLNVVYQDPELPNHPSWQLPFYQELGVNYRRLSNYDKSITILLEALKIALKHKKQKAIYNSYNSLANTYSQAGVVKRAKVDLERALENYEKALKYIDPSDQNLMGMIWNNQGTTYLNMGQIVKDSVLATKAIRFYKLSLDSRVAARDSEAIANSYNNLGSAYHDLYQTSLNIEYLKESLRNYEKGIDIGKKIKLPDIYSIYVNYAGGLALFSKESKDKKKALEAIAMFRIAYRDAIANGDKLNEMMACDGIARTSTQIGSNDTAVEYFQRYISIKDTILSAENKQVAEDLALKYESEIKETENNNLKNQAKLREEVISKKSTTINLMIVGSVLLLGLIVIVLISRQKITKAKRLTEKQKLIIEEKNKEITDSINYAKRLQNTMLPGETSLGTVFGESFILYRPKDIVSGDFYWHSHYGNNRIVAAVDCTGHGVPGAFMSMLGITFLNEIVNQNGINKPHLILGELRDRVKSTLKQKGLEGEARDGMDIALVNVNLEKNVLEFSGANNPIWICRGEQLIEVNADKRPIGYFKGQGLPFTNHSIELKKGDCVYLFTDGYADQFGGPKGKKFKYKTLSDLLLSIHQKPCEQQKQILERTFTDWKGVLDQIDDVLILGIKI